MYALSIVFKVQFFLGLLMATFALFGQAALFDTSVELGVGILLAVLGLSQILTQWPSSRGSFDTSAKRDLSR
jgi:hypothetical protein